MRDVVIRSLDLLVWLVAILVVLAGLVVGIMAMGEGQALPGIGMIVGGILYAVIFAGMFFMVMGIYENTKRTAAAMERMANK